MKVLTDVQNMLHEDATGDAPFVQKGVPSAVLPHASGGAPAKMVDEAASDALEMPDTGFI